MAIQIRPNACEDLLATAIRAASEGGDSLRKVADNVSTPLYATDADGRITYFNAASVAFAGRAPVVERDRWCVTWKLFDTRGTPLPHERCPMAVAVKEKRPVRGIEAVAERPDGSRITFVPYPTPLLDEAGNVIGAVNMLVDITREKQAEDLMAQARKCRRLAKTVSDEKAAATLTLLARDYENKAKDLQSST